MSRLAIISRKTASSRVLTSGALTQSLLLIEQIGEAANVPGLKGFAGVATVIVNICNSASSNKDEWRALEKDVGELVAAVSHVAHENQESKEMDDPDLVDAILDLRQGLEAVQQTLQPLADRGRTAAWFVRHSQDQLTLRRAQRDIKHALDVFKLRVSVRNEVFIRRAERRAQEQYTRILDIREALWQAVLAEEHKSDEAGEDGRHGSPPGFKEGPILPVVSRQFFGREKEIEQIITTLRSCPNQRIALLGTAGIGKTSLAGQVLHDDRTADYFGPRRYFFACDSATSKDDLLTVIATAVGIQGDDLEKKVLKAFQKFKRPTLVVFDNFESPWEPVASKADVETFLANLAAIQELSLLITMRGLERPGKIAWTRPFLPQLEPFDLGAARQTFLALSDIPEDDPNIDKLLKQVDCVPLAVTLMATLAQTDSTDTLLSRWDNEHSSLLQRLPDRTESVDISIRISLESHRMKACPEAFELLTLLALLPDGIENRMLDGMFPNFANSKKALSTLWQTSLAYHDGKGRTRVLSPIRSYMTYHHQTDASNPHLLSLMTYYMGLAGISENLGGPHGPSIIKRLTPEVGNMHSILNIALSPNTQRDPEFLRDAVRAAIDLSRFSRYSSLGNTETLQQALAIARQLQDDRLWADVTFRLVWAEKVRDKVPFAELEKMCGEALAVYERLGHVSGQAECTWLIGSLNGLSKQQTEAQKRYEQALDLAIKSGNKYIQAKCLSSLGEALFRQGKVQESQRQCQESLVIFRELGHLTNIGLLLYMLGQIEMRSNLGGALKLYDEAAEVFEQAGDFANVARIAICRGDVKALRCEFQAAREDYQLSEVIYRDRGQEPSPYTLLSLGEAAAALYDVETSTRYIDAALAVFDGPRKHIHGVIYCQMVRGDLKMIDAGPEEMAEAEHIYSKALQDCLSVGYSAEQASLLVRLGTLETRRSGHRQALRCLVGAMVLFYHGSNVRGRVNVLVRLGDLLAKTGEKESAVAVYRAAYPVCSRLESQRDVADCLCGIGELLGSVRHLDEARALYEKTGDVKGSARSRQRVMGFVPL